MRFLSAMQVADIHLEVLKGSLGEFNPDDDMALATSTLRSIASRSGVQSRAFLRERLGTLVHSLVQAKRDVEFVEDAIDACVGAGDLLVVRDGPRTRYALSPPFWVRRSSGSVFLVGDEPENDGKAVAGQVSRGPYRIVLGNPSDDFLLGLGRVELPSSVWQLAPEVSTPEELIQRIDRAVQEAGRSGDVSLDVIFDPGKPYRPYRRRLVSPVRQSGFYLGRRIVPWGAPTWSYCHLDSGQVDAFVDLPGLDPRFSARDEWYWLMAAVDAVNRTSGGLAIRRDPVETALSFWAPIPSWAERRLLTICERAEQPAFGALMTFLAPNAEVAEELSFIRRYLWLDEYEEDG
jgi:hypothetical protein